MSAQTVLPYRLKTMPTRLPYRLKAMPTRPFDDGEQVAALVQIVYLRLMGTLSIPSALYFQLFKIPRSLSWRPIRDYRIPWFLFARQQLSRLRHSAPHSRVPRFVRELAYCIRMGQCVITGIIAYYRALCRFGKEMKNGLMWLNKELVWVGKGAIFQPSQQSPRPSNQTSSPRRTWNYRDYGWGSPSPRRHKSSK